MQDAAAETAGQHWERTRTRTHIDTHTEHLHARAAADRRRWRAAARQAAASAWAFGPGHPGEGTWQLVRWTLAGGWWWAVGGRRLAVGGCRFVGDGCRVRAWWWAPYNVVLSRRHEPVEHNRTCARSLGRKSQDFGCGRSRSRGRSEERGVVVREILWGGRGVTNTGGPQGRLQVRRGQCKRRQGSERAETARRTDAGSKTGGRRVAGDGRRATGQLWY